MFGDATYAALPYGQSSIVTAAASIDPVVAMLTDESREIIHCMTVDAYTLPAGPVVTLYFADRPFLSPADDTPADTRFVADLVGFDSEASIVRGDGFGGMIDGGATAELINTGDLYTDLDATYALDGRAVEVRVGRYGDRHADMLTIFKGTVANLAAGNDRVKLHLKDRSALLEKPVTARTYPGGGGLGGTEDIEFKRRPVIVGEIFHFTPTLVDPSRNIYQMSALPFTGLIFGVFINGALQIFDVAYTDMTAFLASTPVGGEYTVGVDSPGGVWEDLYIKLGTVPNNQKVTASGALARSFTGSGLITNGTTSKASALYQMGRLSCGLAADDFDLDALAAYEARHPAAIGLYVDSNSDMTVWQAMERLCGESTFAGPRRDGKLITGLFGAPYGPPVLRLRERDILDLEQETMPAGLFPPPHRWAVGHTRVWTDMNGSIVLGVSDTARSFLSQQLRYSGYLDETLPDIHPLSPERTTLDDCYVEAADATAEGTRLYDLYTAGRRLWRVDTPPLGLVPEIGETIHIDHDRLTGRGVVVAHPYSRERGRVTLRVFI